MIFSSPFACCRQTLLLLSFAVLALLHLPAAAHQPGESYLRLAVTGAQLRGQWELSLRDLDSMLHLDADADGHVTANEAAAQAGAIGRYAWARLALNADGRACTIIPAAQRLAEHADGAYWQMDFQAECPAAPDRLVIRDTLFLDRFPQHRGLLRLEAGGQTNAAVFTAATAEQEFTLGMPDAFSQFRDYLREGVVHIWIGIDHVLFLLTLLLPAVTVRDGRHCLAVHSFRAAGWEVLQVVTAFTLAHSLTLALAALGVVALPSRLVESAIAASVIIAALNNIWPLAGTRRWPMAFLFGLLHGFGFASVLGELGLPQEGLALSLLGFNLGVEAGQLVIVAVFLPLAYLLRRTEFYRRIVLQGGSLAIALLATGWLAERALDLSLLPF